MILNWSKSFNRSLLIVVTLGVTMMIIGCGKSGPKKYNISGEVTFQGKPVPVGQVLFQPDISQGNKGPSCVVAIKNGFYDTSTSGSGHIGGAHVAVISGGADQSNLPPEEQGSGMMFREVRIKLDLPKSESVQDIEVPAR